MKRALTQGLVALGAAAAAAGFALAGDPLPPDTTYRPLPTLAPSQARAIDEAQKPQVMQRQRALLDERYDLADRPIPGVMMSGGRKPVQGGVRVKLPDGVDLGQPRRDERPTRSATAACCRTASSRCRTSSRPTGGQVFPNEQIDEIARAGAARPAALRRRLRPARPPHAGVSAADLPDHAPRARRRLARPAADDHATSTSS